VTSGSDKQRATSDEPRASWDAVLFDLDGTLIDSVALILDSFHHSFTTCGLEAPPPVRLLSGVGIPLGPHFARYVDDPALVERLIRVYRQYNLAHHDARVQAFPGVRAMLAGVRAARIRVGVVTSKNRITTDRGLEIARLADLVEAIVTCDDVTHPKPHPEPVMRGLEALGAQAERAVFVGDSLHDMHSGRAAGVRTAAALWGPFVREDLAVAEPDYWVETPAQLAAVLAIRG
jgi:pyrophosphatase PpaX